MERSTYEVGLTLNNLAVAYGKLGDHIRKSGLLERALKITEAHYEKEHLERPEAASGASPEDSGAGHLRQPCREIRGCQGYCQDEDEGGALPGDKGGALPQTAANLCDQLMQWPFSPFLRMTMVRLHEQEHSSLESGRLDTARWCTVWGEVHM